MWCQGLDYEIYIHYLIVISRFLLPRQRGSCLHQSCIQKGTEAHRGSATHSRAPGLQGQLTPVPPAAPVSSQLQQVTTLKRENHTQPQTLPLTGSHLLLTPHTTTRTRTEAIWFRKWVWILVPPRDCGQPWASPSPSLRFHIWKQQMVIRCILQCLLGGVNEGRCKGPVWPRSRYSTSEMLVSTDALWLCWVEKS